MAKVNPIQVQKYLRGTKYPAAKRVLIKRAKDQGADQNLLETLEQVKDQEYQTPAEVNKAIGQVE